MEKGKEKGKGKIKIIKGGPYLVTGGVKLSEKIIVPMGSAYEMKDGRTFPAADSYVLCRCGKTKTPPFCDNAHQQGFSGVETASKEPFEQRADTLRGPNLDLKDDNRCAYARFCHREGGSAWELTNASDDPRNRKEAIQAAIECPAGRLVPVDKDGNEIEPELEPAIEFLQDPQKGVSSGLYVKGGIEIQSATGFVYEKRNRVMLCRCGASRNKPFCDASHVSIGYKDE